MFPLSVKSSGNCGRIFGVAEKGVIPMKSYALAVVVAMLAAAGYVFQNAGDVTVRVLLWERLMPQGVWEVLLFSLGALLMWIVSLFALLEEMSPLKRKITALEKTNRSLEEEKGSLLRILENVRGPRAAAEAPEVSDTLEIYAHPKMAENDPAELCLECEASGEGVPENSGVPAPDLGCSAVEGASHPEVGEEPSTELCLECEASGDVDGGWVPEPQRNSEGRVPDARGMSSFEVQSEETSKGAENSTVYVQASEEAGKS